MNTRNLIRICVTLDDGRNIILNGPEELEECEVGKKVTLVYRNGQMYTGLFQWIDEEGVALRGKEYSLCFPIGQMIGWYEDNTSGSAGTNGNGRM